MTLAMATTPHPARRVQDSPSNLHRPIVEQVRALDGRTVEFQPWGDHVALVDTDTQDRVVIAVDSDDDLFPDLTRWFIEFFVLDPIGFGYSEPVTIKAVEVEDRPGATITALDGTTIATLRAGGCAECAHVPELNPELFTEVASNPLWCDLCCADVDLWCCDTCGGGFRLSEDGGHRNGSGVWCQNCHDPSIPDGRCTVHDDCFHPADEDEA